MLENMPAWAKNVPFDSLCRIRSGPHDIPRCYFYSTVCVDDGHMVIYDDTLSWSCCRLDQRCYLWSSCSISMPHFDFFSHATSSAMSAHLSGGH